MRLTIRGAKGNRRQMIKEATLCFAEELMSSRLLNTLDVEIKILSHNSKECKEEEMFGDLEILDVGEYSPKLFLIRAKNFKNIMILLKTIAHEMVHVKQYATGECRQLNKGGYKFMGKYYEDDHNYWDSPWEIEAMGRERALIKKYLEKIGKSEMLKQKARIYDIL